METSKPEPIWQRTRAECKPGQTGRLKILPEPYAEPGHNTAGSKQAGSVPR